MSDWEVLCRPVGNNPARPGSYDADEPPYNDAGLAVLISDGVHPEREIARVAFDRRSVPVVVTGDAPTSKKRTWARRKQAPNPPDVTAFEEQLNIELAKAAVACDALNDPMRKAREALEAAERSRDEFLAALRREAPAT